MAQIGPTRAMAQLTTVPPQPGNQVPNNIRNDSFLVVPDGGLRLVNSQNRTIGVILDQGGNGGIVFFNNSNRPSVSIVAGNTGQLMIDGGNGPAVRMTDTQGKESVLLNIVQGKPTLRLRDEVTLAADSDGGRLLLKDAQNNNSVRLDTNGDGGRITGFNKAQGTVFNFENKDGEGTATLYDKDGQTGFHAGGKGSAAVYKDKEAVWKVPSDQ